MAIVDQDTDPVSEAENLRAWVEERLGVRNSVAQLERDRNNFETECRLGLRRGCCQKKMGACSTVF